MKKIFIISALYFWTSFVQISAQIAINNSNINSFAVLDFPLGTKKGIILPIIETLPNNAVNGTILMDKNDMKIKMKQNGLWVEMSGLGSIAGINFNTSSENANTSLIIGASSSTATGALVLESTTKALILPKIASPHLNVKSPRAGMICYDTVSNTMAIFDGVNWNYWK